MTSAMPRILALGGHGFSSRPPDRAVCELLLRVATERAGGRPRICLLPAPNGAAAEQVAAFYSAFGERHCEPSDLSLFRLGRRPAALREQLLGQDLVYACGGAGVEELLAVWEAIGLTEPLRLAWRRGIVLAGQSDGAMCLLEPGLGLVEGSWRLDEYAGLLWEGEAAPAAVTARRGSRAYRVESRDGVLSEEPLPARLLPAPAPATLREDIAEYRRITAMRKRAGWLG
jgi:Peptidase family S51